MDDHQGTPNFRGDAPIPASLKPGDWDLVLKKFRFTPTEAWVVSLILSHMKGKQIATVMGISEATVQSHLKNIFERHKLSDRVEVVLVIFETVHGIGKADGDA